MKVTPLTVIRLVWLTARSGPRSTLVLPVLAFTLTTALLLIVVAGALSFFRWQDELGAFYQALAGVALALLVVPLVSLGGSAARLSARRHDEQLSTLRLLGATPALVSGMAILESSLMALGGAVLGTLSYFAATPFVGLIPFRGEPIGAGNLFLSPVLVLSVIAGVVLLAVISSILGLRTVVISPLGVRTRQQPERLSWLRFPLGAAGIAVAYLAISQSKSLDSSWGILGVALVLIIAFAVALGILNIIGPALIGWLARRRVRQAQDPVGLLSARQLLESPKGAWRQVSGVAMSSFVAVFVGVGVAMLDSVSTESASREELYLLADIRTGVLITVMVSFLMVACSVGVNQISQILDRAALLISLDRLGMPGRTMEAARRRAVLMPLRFVCVGSALVAALVLFPITAASLLFSPLTLLILAASLAGGIGLVWLSLWSTGYVTQAVLRSSQRL